MNLRLISFIVSSSFSFFLLLQCVIFLIFFSSYKELIKHSPTSLYYIALIGLFNIMTSLTGILISFERSLNFYYIVKMCTATFSFIFLIYLLRNMLVSLKDLTFVEIDEYKEKTKKYLINFTIIAAVFIICNFIYALFLSGYDPYGYIYKALLFLFIIFLFSVSAIEIREFIVLLKQEKGKVSNINLVRYKTVFFSSIVALLISSIDVFFIAIDKISYIIKFGSMYAYGTTFLSLGLSLNFIFEYLDVLARSSEVNKKLSELNRQMMDDVRTAQSLQISLLPLDKQKDFQNYIDMEISYMPMQSVGGDYYDFYALDDKKILILLGDASGHGIYAAMIWAILKVEIEELIEEGKFFDLGEAFFVLNQRLTRILENTYSYATLFASMIDVEEKKLNFISAGHVDQIYYDSVEKKFKWLKNRNPIMGTFKNARFSVNSIDLKSGDVLILYSDGIVEGLNPSGEQLGKHRLMEIMYKINLDTKNASEILKEILIHLEDFFEGALQKDDRTLMVIKI